MVNVQLGRLKSVCTIIISDSGAAPWLQPVANPFPEPAPATVVPWALPSILVQVPALICVLSQTIP